MAPPRRFRWGFLLLGAALVGLIVWLVIASHRAPPKGPPPRIPVSVATATLRDVPLYVQELGAAQAWMGVLINPQINGRLVYVAPEGTNVRAGDLLAAIDCSPYQAALTQAEGTLKRDQALLQGAQADLDRYRILEAQNSIARQTAEDQAATVRQDQGVVQADEGSVAAAKVNVGYCKIPSPISGRVGVRLIDPGNIVGTSTTTGIISVNQITPIAVTFTVPQGDFQRLAQASDGFTRPLTTEAFSQETNQLLGTGELIVADNHVDQTTGTVEMKARFPNLDQRLWPGQFVNVRLTVQTLAHVLTIPSVAVNQGPNGPYVYVVGPNDRVSEHAVKVISSQQNVAVVQSGVSPGQSVVTDGQMSIKDGSLVAPKPAPPTPASGSSS